MHLSFIHPFKINREESTLVPLHEPERNTSDGGEFMDDALRMEDMIPRTEEFISSGTPGNLS
ncbi:MAG: hypothetical protein JST68_30885 [Bacteroidetes bacterium]|nr:hypothetical protein [Bacteroidota bacterium]